MEDCNRQRNNTRMDNNTEDTLAVRDDKSPVLPDLGLAVNNKYRLVGARLFVATKAGLDSAVVKKQTMAQVCALAVAEGATEQDCKDWRAEYDALEAKHQQISRTAIAVYASNPEWKQKFSLAVNAKGQVIGANAMFRRQSGKSAIARLAISEARVAKLEALLAQNAALPA
jgi:hypothetical protein